MAESKKLVRERFIEQMGLIAQADGLPRIAGRLLGLMIFDGREFSFGELATELQVSRGSVSSNARVLEQIGIIERISKPGDRQDYFQLTEDPYSNIIKGAIARTSKAQVTVSKTIDALPKSGNTDIKKRLTNLAEFYGTVNQALVGAIKKTDDR